MVFSVTVFRAGKTARERGGGGRGGEGCGWGDGAMTTASMTTALYRRVGLEEEDTPKQIFHKLNLQFKKNKQTNKQLLQT